MRGAWLGLLLVLCTASFASAQEKVVVHEVGGRQVCTIRVAPYAGSDVPGGFGWFLVDVQNHERTAHAVLVDLSTTAWSAGDFGLQRTIALGPEEQARFYLPLPNIERATLELKTNVDGGVQSVLFDVPSARGCVGLLVGDRANLQPAAFAVLQDAAKGRTSSVLVCSGMDVPADWRLFTGFHLVMVDGRSPLGADAQDALRRYVCAGGRVVVGSAASLPPGPLRERLERLQAPASRAEGLGTWVAVDDLAGATRIAEQVLELLGTNPELWPLPAALQKLQPVPGLGRAPVLVFLLVILCFAVLAGPVNFFLLRKWRRPLLALVTVPALGFGTTLLMLGYAFLHDGFGVRGAVRSWTLLDQAEHTAVATASRTLFAGLSPGSLSLSADALLIAPASLGRRDQRNPNRFQFSADTNRIDGAVLPSRTPTVLTTAQQGVVRDRLRVRVRPEGGLELLADGGIQLSGEILVRDRDGACWLGTAPVLQPCTLEQAEQYVSAFGVAAGHLATMEDETDYDGYRSYVITEPTADERSVAALSRRWLGSGGPEAGTWYGRLQQAPWLDDHGIRVDYDLQEHFVIGRLAAEDILR